MNEKQHALAAEIRAEMAAQRITATEMQGRTGIKHASWRNWFVTATRPVPYPELEKVCAVLGVPLSHMLVRAERRASPDPEAVAALALSQLSPEAQEKIARVSADLRPQQPPTAPGRASGQ